MVRNRISPLSSLSTPLSGSISNGLASRRNRGKMGQAARLTPSRRSIPACQLARWPFHSEVIVDRGPSGCKVGD